MRLTSLSKKLVFFYVALMIAVLSASGLLLLRYIYHVMIDSLAEDLRVRAMLVAERVLPEWPRAPGIGDSVSRYLAEIAEARVTLVALDGTVLGDSSADSSLMENHSQRPEIRAALAGSSGESMRMSPTTGERMLYLAVPLIRDGTIHGVVRLSLSAEFVYDRVRTLRYGLISSLGLGLLLAAVSGMWLGTKFVSTPLAKVVTGAREFVKGRLSHRIQVDTGDEWAELAASLNNMASSLDAQVTGLARERDRVRAMLESLPDGVLLFSARGSLLFANERARNWLSLPDSAGEYIQDISQSHLLTSRHREQVLGRTPELNKVVEFSLGREQDTRQEIVQIGPEEIRLEVRSHWLETPRVSDMLVVIRDMTPIRRLEQARRDMVANVSHELKTPVGAIRALAESLIASPSEDEAVLIDFLKRIVRETERLQNLIDEVMYLSRVEETKTSLSSRHADVALIAQRAAKSITPIAQAKQVSVNVSSDANTEAYVDPEMIERAMRCLLENAVKFSPAASSVHCTILDAGDEVKYSVTDEGPGIPEEAQSRVFERFFKVEPSRNTPGWGLGLAVVKHIVEAHGGTTFVESKVGCGSTFGFTLPRQAKGRAGRPDPARISDADYLR